MNDCSMLDYNTSLHGGWWTKSRDSRGIFLACLHCSLLERAQLNSFQYFECNFLHSLDGNATINAQWETKNKYHWDNFMVRNIDTNQIILDQSIDDHFTLKTKNNHYLCMKMNGVFKRDKFVVMFYPKNFL